MPDPTSLNPDAAAPAYYWTDRGLATNKDSKQVIWTDREDITSDDRKSNTLHCDKDHKNKEIHETCGRYMGTSTRKRMGNPNNQRYCSEVLVGRTA